MIYIIVGPPRSGKTFFATKLALKEGLKKPNKKTGLKYSVYTNYPIYDKKTGYSTYMWDRSLIDENIVDATIIVDEAYMDFSSRSYKDFSKTMHAWFATNGHNGVDVYLIAQNASRVDLIIREMVNEFYYVAPVYFLFTDKILWFKVWVYQDLNQMGKMSPDPHAHIKSFRFLFKKRIANAYDTHYFRKPTDNLFNPTTWADKLDLDDETVNPEIKVKVSLFTRLKSILTKLMLIIKHKK